MFCSKVCRNTSVYRDFLLGRLPRQRCSEKGNKSGSSVDDQRSIVSQVRSALAQDREELTGDEDPNEEESAVNDCEDLADKPSVEELAAFIGPVNDPRVRACVAVGCRRPPNRSAQEQTMAYLHHVLYNKKSEGM